MKRLLGLAAFAVLAAAGTDVQARDSISSFAGLPRSGLQVVTQSGTHHFQVWIAADDHSRERGLMFVRTLPPDEGMLFLFERPQYAAFWMKNTYLSLDLVFIRADGVVVNVAENARPLTLDPIPSVAPVKAVLELLAGTSARIGLMAGSRIVHPAFTAKAASVDDASPGDARGPAPQQPGNAVLNKTR